MQQTMLLARLPTMPTLVEDLIIDSDSESEDDTLPKTPTTPTTPLPAVLIQPHKSVLLVTPNHRPIAGSQRVRRFREMHGCHISQEGGEILQSITASPALGHQSFEELRIECYMQSLLATGSPPKAVDPRKTPWGVIPPAFHTFHLSPTLRSACGDEPEDVVMD